MIARCCRRDCPRCNAITEELREPAIRFDLAGVPPGGPAPAELAEEAQLPVLVDEDGAFRGTRTIVEHLTELDRPKEDWYRSQSDVCCCVD